jgi:hypothetical protein
MSRAKKDKKYSMGGWLDEFVPNIKKHLRGVNIDREKFTTDLGVLLGRYRIDRDNPWPTPTEEKKAFDKYIRALKTMLDYSAHGYLPPRMNARLVYEMYASGVGQDDLHDALIRQLTCAFKVRNTVAHWKPPLGARRRVAQGHLLNYVFDKLTAAGAGRADARKRAKAILEVCGIVVPADERNIRAAQRRAKG